MNKLYIFALTGLIAFSCITPIKAEESIITAVTTTVSDVVIESNLVEKAYGLGVLGLCAAYGCAVYNYGAAQVNAFTAATVAAISGFGLATACVKSGIILKVVEASQYPLITLSGNPVTAIALLMGAGLGGLTYVTVYDYLDMGNTVTTKNTVSLKRSY